MTGTDPAPQLPSAPRVLALWWLAGNHAEPWVTPLLLSGLVETTQETSSKTIPRLLLQLICLLSLSDQPRSALYCIRDRNHCPVFGLVTFRSV